LQISASLLGVILSMRRITLIAALIAAAGIAVWYGISHSRSKAENAPSWRTATVERGSIIAAVNATGTINPTATAIVGSQVSGQVLEIFADFNSNVKAGDVLARLNAEQIRARLDAARADLAQSQAMLEIQKAQVEKVKADVERSAATKADALANIQKANAIMQDAEKTLTRQTELSNRGVASQVVLQQAQTAVLTQRAARDQARAQQRSVDAQINALAAELKVAETQILSSDAQRMQREAIVRQIEVDIKNSDIRSPVDGIVIQRNIELGQSVAASLQAPTLFLVAQDLSKIEIYANIDEADVGRVNPDQAVTFTVTAFPAREFTGRVKTVRLGSQNVQNVVIYTAVIEVQNSDLALKPGMTATIRILTESRENILRLSNGALRWRPPGETTATTQPNAAPNPFSVAPTAGSGGGGQAQGRQMLERIATELKLDEAQKKQLEEFAREARQSFAAQGAPDTPETRRSRGRQVVSAIAEKLKPILRQDQVALFDAWQATVGQNAAARASNAGQNAGVPARVYVIGNDGAPSLVTVRTGATDGTNTEIVSGLQEGQKLIVGGGPKAAASAFRPPRGL
jgi:HlyD family secretion protein